jgi:hypothetical protein
MVRSEDVSFTSSTRTYLYIVVLSFHSPEYLHSRSSEQPFPLIPLTPSPSTTPFTPYSSFFYITFHTLSLYLSHTACLLQTSSSSFCARAPYHLFRSVKVALEECLSTRALPLSQGSFFSTTTCWPAFRTLRLANFTLLVLFLHLLRSFSQVTRAPSIKHHQPSQPYSAIDTHPPDNHP